MDLHLSENQLRAMETLEQNCSRQISVVNDIFSWEKELKASQIGNTEGAVLCSAVKVLSEETSLCIEASKRVLWSMVREWERVHVELYEQLLEEDPDLPQEMRDYVKGLEYQMSGNELWSRTTLRYHNLN